MSADNEDEWDITEEKLKELELNKPKEPTKLLLRPPTLNAPPNRTCSPAGGDNSNEVDPALINAIENPRERMIVFQIENNILNFMNSSENTMEIPPGYNSFRRLLSYRIGQRFGLTHSTGDQLSEIGERSIFLFKTPSSCIPAALLIDLNLGTPTAEGGNDVQDETQLQNGNSSLHATSAAAAAAPRKMLVMKRRPEQGDSLKNKGNSGASRPQQSVEDKERAYQEARARIFGDSETSTPDGNSAASPLNFADEVASGASSPKSDVAQPSVGGTVTTLSSIDGSVCSGTGTGQVSKSPSNSSLSTGIAAQESDSTSRRKSDPPAMLSGQQQQQQQHGGKKVVNASNWKEVKSQTRNHDVEKLDPDFVRRRGSHARGGAGRQQQYNHKQPYQNQQQQQQQSISPNAMHMQMPPGTMYHHHHNNNNNNSNMDMNSVAHMQMQMQLQMQMQMQMFPAGGFYGGGAPMPTPQATSAGAAGIGAGAGGIGYNPYYPPSPPHHPNNINVNANNANMQYGTTYHLPAAYSPQQRQQQQQQQQQQGYRGPGPNNQDFPPLR
mmetsp:Transcript_92955/g.182140  ORF Transcript_92955/g.182140 Transcript_92955/m.182140 type:complete len:553 (+) Transcript_92955:64-1722(+)